MIGYYLLMTFLTEYAFGFVMNIQSSNSKKATNFLSARIASASASISPFVRPTPNLNFSTYKINNCVNSYRTGY